MIRELTYAKASDHDSIRRELKYYCKRNDMLDFRSDMSDVAKKKDIDVLKWEIN